MRNWQRAWQPEGYLATKLWPWQFGSTHRIALSAAWSMPCLVMEWGQHLLGGDALTVATRPVASFACSGLLAMEDPSLQARNTEESSSDEASDQLVSRSSKLR